MSMGSFRRVLGSTIVWMTIVSLVGLQPAWGKALNYSRAETDTASYELEWPVIGKRISVEHTEAGFLVRDDDGSLEQTIREGEFDVRVVREHSGGVVAIVGALDDLGNKQFYTVTLNPAEEIGSYSADVFASDGTVFAEDLVIRPPVDGGPPGTQAVVIVIGAAVVGTIACAWAAAHSDCISECGISCADTGMLGVIEAPCGVCFCACQRGGGGGSGPSSLDDPSGECPDGYHECCGNQCCSDSDPPPSCP